MKSLQGEFKFLALLLVGATMLAMGGFLIYNDFVALRVGIRDITTTYMNQQREMLEKDILNLVTYIDYKKEQTGQRLRDVISQRTKEAVAIAANLVAENPDLPPERQRKLVKDALRDIRYNHGRGYYFAINMNGTEELFADQPQLEGKDLRAMRDTEGRPVIIDMLAIGAEQKEGFYTYTWTKPNQPGNTFPKIAYVKYFAPFDWIIGTGEYLDDVTADVQAEVIDHVGAIHFERRKSGYVFIGDYEGTSLSGPAQGRNMFMIQDANGKFIVQELIRAARAGGGFVEYVMPGIDGNRALPKLSYVTGIDDWGWYVGAGIYIDELEALVLVRKKEHSELVLRHLGYILGGFASLFLVNVLLSTLLARRLGRNLALFSGFFKKAAKESVKIEVESLRYREFRDIARSVNEMLTERDRLLSETRDARDEWAETFNAIEDGIFLLDGQGLMIQANRAALNLAGMANGLSIGQHFSAFCHENSPVARTLEDGLAHANEVGCSTSQGLYHAASFPMHSEGKLTGIIVVIRDLSEQRSLEQQLHQAQKMESVGRLAGGVAHDFNNILSVINGYAELCIMKLAADNPLKKDIQTIHEAGMKAVRLTGQLLAFSRKQIIRPEILDLNDELLENKKMLGRLLGEDITLRYLHGKGLWPVKMDRSQLEQVIMNLAVNARDAMPMGGTLTMETSNLSLSDDYAARQVNFRPGDYVLFTISDSGKGMAREILEHVFEPFFTTKEKGRGTGLGLATVHGIVKQNGGEINVYSEVDRGTVFKIYLPRAQDGTLDAEPRREEAQRPPRGKETILLVEDDEMVRGLVVEVLSGLGYTVLEAHNGDSAVETVSRFHGAIDLLLTDVIMPGMSGPDLVRRLRKITSELKVLYMSGYTEDTIVHHGVLMDGINFIHKPIETNCLAAAVREVIDHGEISAHTDRGAASGAP